MQETQVRSLDRDDPLEKEVATRSSILAWEIPWTEEPGGLQCMGVAKSRTGLNDNPYELFSSLLKQNIHFLL